MIWWWLFACGFPEDRYQAEVLDLYCQKASDCVEGLLKEDCLTALLTVDYSACDYDPKAARDCSEAVEAATCIDDTELAISYLEFPPICETVYLCPNP